MRSFILGLFLLLSGQGSIVYGQDPVFNGFFNNGIPASLSLDANQLAANISSQQRDFKTLSARIKMHWNDGSVEQDFVTSVRIKKDSLIWMSFGMMGVEGVRLLITRDSVHILDQLAGEYDVRDFSFLQRFVLFPVNFDMLQQIIAGGKIPIGERAALAGEDGNSAVLFSESEKILEVLKVDTMHYKPEKLVLKDKLLKQDMTITFGRYNYSEAKPFSYQRDIVIHRDETTATLQMEFTKLNFDEELTYPFEVNEKLKRNK